MAFSVPQRTGTRWYLPLLVLILLLGLLLRVWFWHDQGLAWNVGLGDEDEYYRGAIHILLQGDYFDSGKWLRPPVTSIYFAGAFAALGINLPLALLFETALSLMSIPLTAALVRNLFRREDYAAAAAASVAFFLPFAAYASRILSETIFIVLLALSMLLLERAQARIRSNAASSRMLFFAGVALGLGILTRAFLFYYVFLLFFWLWVEHRRFAAAIRSFVPLALGVFLVIVPWTIRNSLVYHQLVFVDTESGYSFLNGADPGVNEDALQSYWLKAYSNSADRQRAQFAAGIEIVRKAPLVWIGRMRDKVVGLWHLHIRNLANNGMRGATVQFSSVGFSAFSDVEYIVLVIGALAGLVLVRRSRLFLPLVGLPLYTTLLGAATVTSVRIREPLMLVPVVYAASVMVDLPTAWRGLVRASRWAKLFFTVALVIFLVLIYSSAYVGFFEGQSWLILARLGQGESAMRQAVAADPDNVLPYLALGKFELGRGNTDSALKVLTEANGVMPDNTDAQAQLIQVLRMRGDLSGAAAQVNPVAEAGWDNLQWYEWGWERVPFSPRAELDMGAPAVGVLRGVYPATSESGMPVRWTIDRADFRVALPGANTLALRLRSNRAVGIQVSVDGYSVASLQVTPVWSEFLLPLPKPAGTASLIELKAPTLVESADDPYARGVQVAGVGLRIGP